jgi:diketogulonate reductase-like aldo/keto reductase
MLLEELGRSALTAVEPDRRSSLNPQPQKSMSEQYLSIDGIRVPRFLYGTAWKEDATQRLVELALRLGFRGIDTANQRRHYDEAAVGQAIAESTKSGLVVREDLFLQTKFTFPPGQDHRLPYDPGAPVDVQVTQSLTSSLAHLGCEAVDSFLLHGPSQRAGLARHGNLSRQRPGPPARRQQR